MAPANNAVHPRTTPYPHRADSATQGRHSPPKLYPPTHPLRIKVGFLGRKPTLMRIWWEIDGRRIAPTCVPRESRRASNRPFTHIQPTPPKQPHPHTDRDSKEKSPLPQLYTAPYTEAQEILRRASPHV